jgi:hypothetical protein
MNPKTTLATGRRIKINPNKEFPKSKGSIMPRV